MKATKFRDVCRRFEGQGRKMGGGVAHLSDMSCACQRLGIGQGERNSEGDLLIALLREVPVDVESINLGGRKRQERLQRALLDEVPVDDYGMRQGGGSRK